MRIEYAAVRDNRRYKKGDRRLRWAKKRARHKRKKGPPAKSESMIGRHRLGCAVGT